MKVISFLILVLLVGCAGSSSDDATAVSVDLTGAIGLKISAASTSSVLGFRAAASSSATDKKLKKIKEDGSIEEAGSGFSVSKMQVRPNNKVILQFDAAVKIDNVDCILAEVSDNTNIVCLETDFSIDWPSTFYHRNKAIQFDAEGNYYYKSLSTIRKRSADRSTKVDIENAGADVSDFTVAADGSVYVMGATTATSSRWVRKIATTGSTSYVKSGLAGDVRFMSIFPDSNLYFGIFDDNKVEKFVTSTETLTTPSLIGRVSGGQQTDCTWGYCDQVDKVVQTQNPELVFVLISNGGPKTLLMYYPTVTGVDLFKLDTITAMEQAGDHHLLISGTLGGVNKLIHYDTGTGIETDLLSDVEVYHMGYNSSSDKVVFDGLNFSNNKYITGQVKLSNQTYSEEEDTAKPEDVQSLH